ncbi:hypothetical protein FTX61_03625 [Nitriliruptoraceae bacterium ZYF776]|nr:hypothetical protein [Profundirhabdus halotolerans]
MRTRYKPVTADQKLRDLRKEFKGFEREEPGADRAARLAAFARAAHDERQLNMAMHAAQLCLDDDPDAPSLLVAAYDLADAPVEDQLRSLSDLADLARYVERADVREHAETEMRRRARAWAADADQVERRHRLRTLTSVLGREQADAIRDELEFGS